MTDIDPAENPENFATIEVELCLPCHHGDHQTCYGGRCQCDWCLCMTSIEEAVAHGL